MTVRILHSGPPCLGAIIRCDGIVLGKQLIEVNDLIVTEEGHRYQLWDFSDADYIEVTLEETQKLANQDFSISENSTLEAIVIVGAQKSLMRLIDNYRKLSAKRDAGDGGFEVVNLATFPDAQDWLRDHLGITQFD